MKVMPQPVDLFSPEVWATDHRFGNTLPEQLRFLAEERTALGQSSVRDYLYGVAWHSEQPVVSMAVFSEQWLFNMGFAGWRQGVYEPLPNHAVYRAMICNIANAVNHPDWTNGGSVGATSSFQDYCDFGASPACGDELDELTGPEPCDLVSTGSSGFHVAIDTNMQRDSAAEHTSMLKGAQSGSLSLSWLTADLYGSPAAPVSSDTTVPATLPSNVDTLMWDFFPDMHETLEGVCDVAETSDFFFGQPSVPAMFGGTGPELEACMMTGRESVATITGMGGASDYAAPVDGNDQVARDSVMHFSSLGSGHPDLFVGVEYSEQLDEYGGSDALDFSSTSGAQAAACMWNPQWRHIATISTTSMRSPPAPWDYDSISPWCPSGSSWVAGRQYVNVEDTVPPVYQYMCADLGLNRPFDPNNCVRAASPGTLTVAMKPDLGSLVEVQPEWVGRTVRAQAIVGNNVPIRDEFMRWVAQDPMGVVPPPGHGPANARSCYAAWGWKYGFNSYGDPYPDVLRGVVFFLSASGELVTTSGVTPGPFSCGAAPLDLSGPAYEAEVRPLFINFSDLPVAVVSVTAEVPAGAVRMGVRFDLAGVNRANSEPVVSDVTMQLALPGDPRVRRSLTQDSSSDYPVDPQTGEYPVDPATGRVVLAPPTACEDPEWFVASSARTDQASYPSEADCLMLFGTNQ